MPGKARVHELAKEFGVDSKTVLATLKEQGEFVKSASSTVKAPVARRLREALGPPAVPAPGRGPRRGRSGGARRRERARRPLSLLLPAALRGLRWHPPRGPPRAAPAPGARPAAPRRRPPLQRAAGTARARVPLRPTRHRPVAPGPSARDRAPDRGPPAAR